MLITYVKASKLIMTSSVPLHYQLRGILLDGSLRGNFLVILNSKWTCKKVEKGLFYYNATVGSEGLR